MVLATVRNRHDEMPPKACLYEYHCKHCLWLVACYKLQAVQKTQRTNQSEGLPCSSSCVTRQSYTVASNMANMFIIMPHHYHHHHYKLMCVCVLHNSSRHIGAGHCFVCLPTLAIVLIPLCIKQNRINAQTEMEIVSARARIRHFDVQQSSNCIEIR